MTPLNETVSLMLAACRAQPEDDTARLVLADAVEESRHPGAAQFIRDEVRGIKPRQRSGTGIGYCVWLETAFGGIVTVRANENYRDLHLWAQNLNHRRASLEIRRGLPEVRFITAPLFLELPNLFLFPLSRVIFRDRNPKRDMDYPMHPSPWCWHPAHWPQKFDSWEMMYDFLPPCLWDRLDGYDKTAKCLARRYATSDDATRDLERAALAYGRSLVAADVREEKTEEMLTRSESE